MSSNGVAKGSRRRPLRRSMRSSRLTAFSRQAAMISPDPAKPYDDCAKTHWGNPNSADIGSTGTRPFTSSR